MENIGILDIGMGNIRSVFNAIYENGFDPIIVDSVAQLDDMTHLVIPGVGAYRTAMSHIAEKNFYAPLKEFAESGRPLLGICLGMQILSDSGVEGGVSEGLGVIHGEVLPLDVSEELRVPHVGWNEVVFDVNHPIFEEVKTDRDFYFVHSYAFNCANQNEVIAHTNYGKKITCIVGKGNVVGIQFHPEKSQVNGLKILENFCSWDGLC